MKILAVDTTRDRLTVVLVTDENTYIKDEESGRKGHASSLLPYVDELMKEAKLSPCDLDAVAAVVGAGSFTGIRIGVATMNAIAFAADLKRISVTAFDLLAEGTKGEVFCTVPATHGNLFGAVFEDGKIKSMDFYEADELPNYKKVVAQEKFSDFARALSKVVRKKYENGEFEQQLRPLYLRKSQAERNAE